MDWPMDELVTMEADDVSRWLADRGVPGVTFLFVDPAARRLTTWSNAGEAARRRVLESLRPAAVPEPVSLSRTHRPARRVLRSGGRSDRAGRGCPADDPRRRAAIRVGLGTGQDEPGVDVQLTEALRQAARRGLAVAAVFGAVGGALSDGRRGQVARLFEQLRAHELPGIVEFPGTAPTDLADLAFLGAQARAHRFSITVGPRHVVVATPWDGHGAGAPPA